MGDPGVKRSLVLVLSLLLNVALLAAGGWYLAERGARSIAEDLGVVEAERVGSRDEPEGLQVLRGAVPDRDDLADPALRDGATSTRADWAHAEPRREDYDRAAMAGTSELDRLDREAATRGEESQDAEAPE